MVARNWIHGNTVMQAGGALPFPGKGGGLYAENLELDLCSNQIYDNVGIAGCGVFYQFQDTVTQRFLAQDNTIHDNLAMNPSSANQESFQGGGVAIRRTAVPNPGEEFGLGIIRNRIYGNSVVPSSSTGGIGAAPTRVGGGIYIDNTFLGAGPVNLPGLPGPQIIGNAIFDNTALDQGGGVYLATQSTFPIHFHQNTVTGNSAVGPLPQGPGLFFPSLTNDTLDASGNIVQGNSPVQTVDWFAESPGFPIPPFRYSFLDDVIPLGSDDLFDAATCSSAIPVIAFEGPSELWRGPRQEWNSPTIGFSIELSGVVPWVGGLANDLAEGVREVGTLDVGCDEWDGFRRGDVNVDGSFDVSDAVFLLNGLFVPSATQPTCDSAADVNDDEVVDLADPVFALASLFIPGSPTPPPPVVECGVDPTPSTLSCASREACF